MKKINFGFKKQKNSDALIKRNWKKIWIWTSVVLVLIAGIIPAIYFPVVNSKQDNAGEPMPTSLNAANVDEAVNKANNASEDEVWGLYIDIEENAKSDFAIYGLMDDSDDDGEEEFNKDEFAGPFSEHAKQQADLADGYEWLTFWDKTTEEATDMLAEFMWEINKDQLDTEYGTVYESYFEISLLDPDTAWEQLQEPGTDKQMSVNKQDKTSEGDEEDTYELSFGDSTTVDGPLWLTFKGNDLVFVVTDITDVEGENSITTQKDFDDLMFYTSEYNYNEGETPITNENK